MAAGYSRMEAGAIPLMTLPNILCSIYLKNLNRLREALVVARIVCSDQAYNKVMHLLDQDETHLGRRLPSALDNASNDTVRRRLEALRSRHKHLVINP